MLTLGFCKCIPPRCRCPVEYIYVDKWIFTDYWPLPIGLAMKTNKTFTVYKLTIGHFG